jgi:glycerophosphoryl diester phosphodiesterase
MPDTLILGHRGAPLLLPENTLGSFRQALADGADGVELDVQPSADGVPVVIHDDTVDRTTDGNGAIATLSWPALRALHTARGERIPELQEVAGWAAETGAWLNVELKAYGVEHASLQTLERSGVLSRTIVSSFDSRAVVEVKRLAPEVRCYLLLERWTAEAHDTAARIGVEGICLDDTASTPEALAELAAAGLQTIIWTVDDPARVRTLLQAGVVGIITNRPAMAVRLREELAQG